MLLKGKKGIIFGIANEKSLAWGIAKEASRQGAEMIFTYQSDVFLKRLKPLAEEIQVEHLVPCDVSDPKGMENAMKKIKDYWSTWDFMVHAISFSDKEQLRGDFLELTQENFLNTMNLSCFSFIDMVRQGVPHMNPGGSILTLSYYGAEKVVPHYNVMGVTKAALEASVRYCAESVGKKTIRVNGLSCGPIKTLAASGIGDFHYILKWNQHNSPLRRNITLEDVGGSGVYMLSSLSSGVTGEILYVDAGYHAMGMKAVDAPDLTLVHNS